MTDEKHTFETARVRLEEIAAEVRKKDTSLEKSLDLLEEGVRLANICTDLVDHTDMTVAATPVESSDEPPAEEPGISADVADDSGTEGDAADHDDEADAGAPEADDGFADDYDDLDEPSDAASDE